MFTLTPIDPAAADQLRRESPDAPVYVADEHPGYPCRQCLRDAEVGEELILVSHDPFRNDSTSPYRSASPIFLHRQPCEPPEDVTTVPAQLTGRTLSVRAFDAAEMMVDAAILPGADLAAQLAASFTDPTVDHVHIHNASRGCWATRADRR